jgi:hypothetical protein
LVIERNQPIENEVVDGTTGCIGAENGIENLCISGGPANILFEPLWISYSLFVVGGNPEKGLGEKQYKGQRKKYQNPFDKHERIIANQKKADQRNYRFLV